MNNISLKFQIIFSYLMILCAAVLSVFSLGFMSGFFNLFMDGTSEMYSYFKDLQILNNALFNSSLIYLVLSLFLTGFDVNKKIVGIFGVLLTLVIAVVNIMNGLTIFVTNQYFFSAYEAFDFSGIEGYHPSVLPFNLVYILFALAILFSVILFVLTGINFLKNRKKGVISEK